MLLPEPFVEPTERRVRVRLGGAIVADTTRAQLLVQYGPGGLPMYYVPVEDVVKDALVDETIDDTGPDPLVGRCRPFAGRPCRVDTLCSDRPDGGARGPRDVLVSWSYPDPIPENPTIRDLVVFFTERVDLVVDGEPQERPVTPWSEPPSRTIGGVAGSE